MTDDRLCRIDDAGKVDNLVLLNYKVEMRKESCQLILVGPDSIACKAFIEICSVAWSINHQLLPNLSTSRRSVKTGNR